MTDCVVYGVGSRYVLEVREILRRLDWRVRAWIVNVADAPPPEALHPLAERGSIEDAWRGLAVVIPLLTPGYRRQVEAEARSLGFGRFPGVIDPTVTLASSATVAEGSVVNACSIIGAGTRIERFVSVNRGVSIGHDNRIRDFATLGPGAILCGGCELEPGAFIGAGAVLNPGVRVGRNAVVGSGAVVIEDVPARSMVAGNPARVLREGIAGYNDAAV